MSDFINLTRLMRLPMQRWWLHTGKWLSLPVFLLSVLSALHYMVMPAMPLYNDLLRLPFVNMKIMQSLEHFLSIPIMLLFYAFVGLWVSAALACQRELRELLEESVAPLFDASPLARLLIAYGQGLLLLPVALLDYSLLGFLNAQVLRLQSAPVFTSLVMGLPFGSSIQNSMPVPAAPEHYVYLVQSISQFSASAFSIAALALWITALSVAGGRLVAGGFLALRSLDVLVISLVMLLGAGSAFEGRPLMRYSAPHGEFWLCIPFMLLMLVLLARGPLWLNRLAMWLLAVFALSPAFFTAVLPRSFFIEDTWFARLINSLHYMYYGIGGPIVQLQASIDHPAGGIQFREHLLLQAEQKSLLFTTTQMGLIYSWLGNLLILGLLMLLVLALVRFGVPRHLRRV